MSKRAVTSLWRFSVLIPCACLLIPAPAPAQSRVVSVGYRDTLRTGDEIRLWSATPPLQRERAVAGLVLRDSLVLEEVDRARRPLIPNRVALAGVTRLEVNRPNVGSRAAKVAGIVLVGLAGAVVGGVGGYSLETALTSQRQEFTGLLGFVIGAPIGTLIGALTASHIISTDRWVEVAVPR